jgi:dethiobiotin synthetase
VNGYFVTGTGTGVGKTYVTAAIARAARDAGQRVFAFKPIETGCAWCDGKLVGSDQAILCEAAGSWQTGLLRGVYQFEPPVAPAVASPTIDLVRIHQAFLDGAACADLVLVEGAGGWRVPITKTADMSTLARDCGLPVIVVATATLGTINHSLLTLEAVERDGLTVAALVLSRQPSDDSDVATTNAREISTKWSGRVLIYAGNSQDLAMFSMQH